MRRISTIFQPNISSLLRMGARPPRNVLLYKGEKEVEKEGVKIPDSIQGQNGDIRLSCTVIPNAKVSTVKGVTDESVQLKISQPAVEGKANEGITEYLSELFGVRKRCISIDVGARSRTKVVTVSAPGLTRESVYNKLLEVVNEKT